MPVLSWGRRCFFFNDTATTEIYTLSLHDALPMLGDDAAWVIHPDFPLTRPSSSASSSPVVKLEKPVALRGRVLNAKGAGVKADLFIGSTPAGSSGDDGAFTIARAPSKWAALRAVAGKEAGEVSHTGASSIEIRLRPVTLITGTL